MTPSPARLSGSAAALVAGNTAFAFDLHRRLATRPGNLCYSPYSISITFAMAWAGARGETARQLRDALHLLEGPATPAGFAELETELSIPVRAGFAVLRSANAVWLQRGWRLYFRREFRNLLARAYHSELHTVDYQRGTAADRINAWVAARTEGSIDQVVPEIPRLTRLALVNALYLKAEWQHTFRESDTRPGPFAVGDGRDVTVPMMHQVTTFLYHEDADLQLLEMPYAGGDLAMVILLPRDREGLPALERRLAGADLPPLLSGLESETVDVLMPQFRVNSGLDLKSVMQDLGATDAFDGARADFSGMDGRRFFHIGIALHRSVVAVDETGTEAAAATFLGAEFGRSFRRDQPRIFHADHPFLFLIRQRSTDTILFVGRVQDPTGT
jgi:serpin B